MILRTVMLERKTAEMTILVICLLTIFLSLLQIKTVVEPVMSLEMNWDRRFPADQPVLSGVPDGTMKLGLFSTQFDNALVKYKEYSLTNERPLILNVNPSEQIMNRTPLVVPIIERSNLSDLLLGDIVSDNWISFQQDMVEVDFESYPRDSIWNKSLAWDLNFSAFNPGFHQISYQLATVEDWSGFEALILWVKGDYDPSLFQIGVGSQDGSVAWYNAINNMGTKVEEWTMLLLTLHTPEQGSFNVSIAATIVAQYYVNGTGLTKIWLSDFYLSRISLGNIVSANWISLEQDNLVFDYDNYPPESLYNKSLAWTLNDNSSYPAVHQISCQMPTVEDWSDFDALVLWVKGDYDQNLLQIGIGSQDDHVGWYIAADNAANATDDWTMLFLPLNVPSQSDFTKSSVTTILAQYHFQNDSIPISKLWLSNFYLANIVLSDIVSSDWLSWQDDTLSVDLSSYPPESFLNKSLVWDLNYSAYNPGFHQISCQLAAVEDWSSFEALKTWIKGNADMKSLQIGVGSHDGSVAWYNVVDHVFNSMEEWKMLYLPLDTPDQGSFDTSSITNMMVQYFLNETQPIRISLGSFQFARSDFALKKASLKNESLLGLPILESQLQTGAIPEFSNFSLEIIPSEDAHLTKDTFIVVAARVLGDANSVRIGVNGIDVDEKQVSSEILSLPEEQSFSLNIVRLHDQEGFGNSVALNKILLTYECGPEENVSITTQFLILNLVEGMPTVDGIPLASAVGGTLTLIDVRFPHMFNWSGLKPLEIYIVSTFHEFEIMRETKLGLVDSTWHVSYNGSHLAKKISVNIWFDQTNDASISSAKVTVMKNQTEVSTLNKTEGHVQVPISSASEGASISIVFSYWSLPWAIATLASCAVLSAMFVLFLYKRALSSPFLARIIEKITRKQPEKDSSLQKKGCDLFSLA